ncbi:MAG: D-alanine--D-alanine ligase [Treponemataceae bacterium]|nr:D-alanine--D-alanine ligase [Treponemataceae bacterium]
MRIAVIYGGKTGEHEVSQVSASSVARNLDSEKHTVNLISITKEGEWFLQPQSELKRIKEDPKAVLSDGKTDVRIAVIPGGGVKTGFCKVEEGKILPLETDIVFPVLHGTYGEDGLPQGLFEMAELPYCGCDVMSSAVSMDKEKTKQIWQTAGLPIVPFVTIHRRERDDDEAFASIMKKIERDFEWPVFVKPCKAGSSVGAGKASSKEELVAAVDEALLWDDKILVEPFVEAREIECSVTGFRDITSYIPGEIIPSHEFYDYDAKYIDPDGAALRIPADLEDDKIREVRDIAIKAFKALDGCGFSRIDFFQDKKTGAFFLNEINTIPGFTNISMFPKLCEASGLPYGELLEKLMALGIERFKAMRSLKTSRK